MLRLYARFHQVKQIYFGGTYESPILQCSFIDQSVLWIGAHDAGYARELASLQTEGLLEKIHLLHGNSQKAVEIERFNLPKLTLGDIFHSIPLNSRAFPFAHSRNDSNTHSMERSGSNSHLEERLLKETTSATTSPYKAPTALPFQSVPYQATSFKIYSPETATTYHKRAIDHSKVIFITRRFADMPK